MSMFLSEACSTDYSFEHRFFKFYRKITYPEIGDSGLGVHYEPLNNN